MSTTQQAPDRVTIQDVVSGVKDLLGDTGVEMFGLFVEMLGLVARTDSIEEKSKTGRESAIYAELWLKVQQDAISKTIGEPK